MNKLQRLRYRNPLLALLAILGAVTAVAGVGLPASASNAAEPVISISGSTISWAEVPNADGYNIYINDDYTTTISATSFTASMPGTYYVTSFDKGTWPTSYSRASNRVLADGSVVLDPVVDDPETDRNKNEFGEPVISVDGSTISWPAVSDADGYNIYFNDSYTTTISATSYTAPSEGMYYVTAFDKDQSPTAYSRASNRVVALASEPAVPPPPEEPEEPEDSGYSPVFRDDFDGNTVSSNFFVPGWTSSPRDGRNSAEACDQANGELLLSFKKVGDERLACYLISNVGTYGPGDDATTKVEYRANVSQVQARGTWFAGWLYSRGSTDGVLNAEDGLLETGSEFDVFEYMPTNKSGFNSAIHDHPIRHEQWSYPDFDLTQDAYHTYAIEWNKNCAAFFVDGTRVFTKTSDVSSAKKHSIMLSMEGQTGTQWGFWNVGSLADNLDSSPALGKIDWVQVSEKNSIDPNLCS